MSEALASELSPAARAEAARRWEIAMRAGDWEAAWRETDRLEAARRADAGLPRAEHHLRWDGTDWADRSVLVRCLHGLGDTLQFMRLVPLVAAQARQLHFLVQPQLLPLLRGLPGLGRVSNAWVDDAPPHEVEIEVMELAYALRCTAGTLPAPPPSLRERAAMQRLAPEAQMLLDGTPAGLRKIGLLWSASDWDPTRSIPLEVLAALLRVPGLRWFSLQQGEAANDARVQAMGMVPLSAWTGAIEDAAAAMLQLDGVIAVDGMPAHLAASLGVPTWLLLKQMADWRWMEERQDSPWYPAMRLWRQAREGDWGEVVERVAEALVRKDTPPSPPSTTPAPSPARSPSRTPPRSAPAGPATSPGAAPAPP